MRSGNATSAGGIIPCAVDPDRVDAGAWRDGGSGPLHARLLPASLIARHLYLSLRGTCPSGGRCAHLCAGRAMVRRVCWFGSGAMARTAAARSLSLLYRELADYCEAKYSLLTFIDIGKALASPC